MKEESFDTFASADEVRNGIKDEQRVLYSPDGKRMLGTAHMGITSYKIKSGTSNLTPEREVEYALLQ